MKLQNLNLSEIAEGAIQEHFERELEKVMDNINDLGTDPGKKRKITLTLDLKADDRREIIHAEVGSKSTLAPVEASGFNMMTGIDSNGERVVGELKSGSVGQAYIADDGEVKNDDGTEIQEKNSRVTNLYK